LQQTAAPPTIEVESRLVQVVTTAVRTKEFPVATLSIELAQAETQLPELIQEVGSGAEIVITRDGQPVARLVPPARVADRVPGSARGLFIVPDDFDAPLEEFREYT
jgi:prevent-host-death family protein